MRLLLPLLSSIVASQQANGSFDFSGAPGGTGTDPDLTASVVIALTLADDASGPDTAPAVARDDGYYQDRA